MHHQGLLGECPSPAHPVLAGQRAAQSAEDTEQVVVTSWRTVHQQFGKAADAQVLCSLPALYA